MINNPLAEHLKDKKLILASGSPRRKMFFEELGLDFEIRLKPVDEIYPNHLQAHEISNFLAELKASAFKNELAPNEILVTSDTVVWHANTSLAKAQNKTEATAMLTQLSGGWHEVITSVCFTTSSTQKTVYETTKVKFKTLSAEEINYYIEKFRPFDKAGAYGIQEWIGLIAIENMQGSYTNVVGLPTALLYGALLEF